MDVSTDTFKRAIYTLHEAASLYDITVEDILHLGSQDALRLFALIPPELFLFSMNKDSGSIESKFVLKAIKAQNCLIFNEQGMTPEPGITMLQVTRGSCKTIAVQGDAYQQFFSHGLRTTEAGDAVFVEPSRVKREESVFAISPQDLRFDRVFACCPELSKLAIGLSRQQLRPSKLAITIDMLRVRIADLAATMRSPAISGTSGFDIGFSPEPHMPLPLLKLHEAAMKHWDLRQKNWKKPGSKQMIASLLAIVDDHGKAVFSRNMAQAAEFILRKTFENWRQSEYEKRKLRGIVTPFEALVVVASAWRSAPGATSTLELTRTRYRDKKTAVAYFSECRIEKSYLVSAWTIAAPLVARRRQGPV